MEKKLVVCDGLLDERKKFITHAYCAPIFIASIFSGTLLVKEENLVPNKIDENTLRSGTVTFVNYKGSFFALTCKHVVAALEKRQIEWKNEQFKKYDFEPEVDGLGFYTPIENFQYHLNYQFTVVDSDLDIAIARVNYSSIKRLGRKPITLTSKKILPETGVASGYPEEQRVLKKGKNISTFSPKFVTCAATLQESMNGELYMEDLIAGHNDVDVLSGMSGGPIIWSNSKHFGLAGIIKSGYDIQPKKNGFTDENSVFIHAEKVTPALFDKWLKQVPPLKELKDETKSLLIPETLFK